MQWSRSMRESTSKTPWVWRTRRLCHSAIAHFRTSSYSRGRSGTVAINMGLLATPCTLSSLCIEPGLTVDKRRLHLLASPTPTGWMPISMYLRRTAGLKIRCGRYSTIRCSVSGKYQQCLNTPTWPHPSESVVAKCVYSVLKWAQPCEGGPEETTAGLQGYNADAGRVATDCATWFPAK